MLVVFLANGFEETEALTTVDVLRRAELDVVTVGVGGQLVTGSHGIPVVADLDESQWTPDEMEGVVLPGGMPGTLHLGASATVKKALEIAQKRDLLIAAICAAPSVLGEQGLLKGKRATCFPGFEDQLTGATVEAGAPVVCDGKTVTAKGMGVTIPFALAIVTLLKGEADAKRLEGTLQCR
ncbi:MAG: DJ-1 family glyoxalase III [Acutalibacteraceae bacterium]|jgi:4-methyl-5(b-hydroxyethyl)-thiazole monophosphate biosynthesis